MHTDWKSKGRGLLWAAIGGWVAHASTVAMYIFAIHGPYFAVRVNRLGAVILGSLLLTPGYIALFITSSAAFSLLKRLRTVSRMLLPIGSGMAYAIASGAFTRYWLHSSVPDAHFTAALFVPSGIVCTLLMQSQQRNWR